MRSRAKLELTDSRCSLSGVCFASGEVFSSSCSTRLTSASDGMTIVGSSFDFYREYVRESLPAALQTAANLENGARGCVVGTLLYFAEVDPTTQHAQETTHFFQDAAVETPHCQLPLIGTYLGSSTPHLG